MESFEGEDLVEFKLYSINGVDFEYKYQKFDFDSDKSFDEKLKDYADTVHWDGARIHTQKEYHEDIEEYVYVDVLTPQVVFNLYIIHKQLSENKNYDYLDLENIRNDLAKDKTFDNKLDENGLGALRLSGQGSKSSGGYYKRKVTKFNYIDDVKIFALPDTHAKDAFENNPRAGKPMFDRSANFLELLSGGVWFAAGFVNPAFILIPILWSLMPRDNLPFYSRSMGATVKAVFVAILLVSGALPAFAMWYGALRIAQTIFQYPMLRMTSLKWNILSGFKLPKSIFSVLFTLAGITAGAALGVMMLSQIPFLMSAMVIAHAAIGSVSMLAIFGTLGLIAARCLNVQPGWGIFFAMAFATFLPVPAAFTLAVDLAVVSAFSVGYASTFVGKYFAQFVTWLRNGRVAGAGNADGKFVPLVNDVTPFDNKVANAFPSKHVTAEAIKTLRVNLLNLLGHKHSASLEYAMMKDVLTAPADAEFGKQMLFALGKFGFKFAENAFVNTTKLTSNSVKNILYRLDQVANASDEQAKGTAKKALESILLNSNEIDARLASKTGSYKNARGDIKEYTMQSAVYTEAPDEKNEPVGFLPILKVGCRFWFTIPSNNYPANPEDHKIQPWQNLQLASQMLFMNTLLDLSEKPVVKKGVDAKQDPAVEAAKDYNAHAEPVINGMK